MNLNEVHPIAKTAIKLMVSTKNAVDSTSLACLMSGATSLRDKKTGRDVMRAYMHVAADVLGCLRGAGLAERDDDGWFRLTRAGESVYTGD